MKREEINSLIKSNEDISVAYTEWKKYNPYRDKDIIEMYTLGGFSGSDLYVYIKYSMCDKIYLDEYHIDAEYEIIAHQFMCVGILACRR